MKRRFLALTPARRPSTRRVVDVLAGVALAVVTTGCQVNSPVQTDAPYVPADGVPADVGDLAVRDLVLVGDGTGTAVVSGSAINLGDEAMTVQIAPQPDARRHRRAHRLRGPARPARAGQPRHARACS